MGGKGRSRPLSVMRVEEALREIKAAGFRPLTIGGQPAYDPDAYYEAKAFLEARGCRLERVGLLFVRIWAPWTRRWHTITPGRAVEGAEMLRGSAGEPDRTERRGV